MTIKKRKYNNYNDYLSHQSRKLDIGIRKKIKKFMPEYFQNNVKSFEKRIGVFIKYIDQKGKVLCLGARTGAEVLAFMNLGFKDSIGIDINPGKNNKYVIKGDFHHTDFPDESFDTIYTNSIDHAWDLQSLSNEINRIMKSEGKLILEIDHILRKNTDKRNELIKKNSKYESIVFDDISDIKSEFKNFDFIESFTGGCPSFLVAIFKKK